MKIGIYPGSFNPWHKGHRDILNKALQVFDKVIVYVLDNPDKENSPQYRSMVIAAQLANLKNVEVKRDSSSLVYIVEQEQASTPEAKFSVIRGLRNGNDLQYEMNNQYWNEDVGLKIPFVYFITDRSLAHVSSSAIRSVNKLGLKHAY
jgi:pantetheine-phosphate adenylyltransferase